MARPRLHWCPTGDFACMPLHAATGDLLHFGARSSCSDYFVSSYTPTLTALIAARRSLRRVDLAGCRSLLVAKSMPVGMGVLLDAAAEIQSAARILSVTSPKVLDDSGSHESFPTVHAVLDYLPQASLFHLACHGVHEPANPLQSGFILHDGRLTLEKLMTLNLPTAVLAFLSACDTAKSDEAQPDQAVHLASAMLFVGFQSVIATMWYVHAACFTKWGQVVDNS